MTSFDMMTPSAARGLIESIHWKPAIVWRIDAIHVLKTIRFTTLRRNEVGSKIPAGKVKSAMKRGDLGDLQLLVDRDRQQRAATVLVDVDYLIEAHFDMTPRAGPEDSPGKHFEMFKRRAERGQCFHQPCLGAREFAARVAWQPPEAPMPAAIDETRDLGLMLYDIDHAAPGRPPLFFRAKLDKGVLRVPAHDSEEILR